MGLFFNKLESKREVKKVMFSQPMGDMTNDEIEEVRKRAIAILNDKGYEVIDTFFTDESYNDEKLTERGVVQKSVYFIAKSLESMSLCHVVYFCKGWENARGCKIEHEVASEYGLTLLYEE